MTASQNSGPRNTVNPLRRHLFAGLVLTMLAVMVPLTVRAPQAQAQATRVVINEFLAVNNSTLADNSGSFEDWIELRNTTGSTIDLGGWTIADAVDTFTFPGGTTINGGQHLVIWASDEIGRTAPGFVHLPFKLSSDGEPLTLRDPGGALSNPAWPTPDIYPVQIADDSYGIASNGQLRYFTSPTPGAANGGGVGGLTAPVNFSVEHGFYSSTQNVVLNTATPSATIRYTTNGSTPTPSNGTAVSPGTSLQISSTTTLRTVAYRDGWITSPVETRTYFFANDIIRQSGTPSGFPSSSVNGQVFDYGMDPDVVNGNEATISSALTAIPSISIVTDTDNLFGSSNGIYVNASERGAEWERPASIELIDPTGAEAGFDIEGGLRIRGGFSRSDSNPKHSWRLFFRDDYESALEYPLFGAEGDDRFEKVDLRTSQNFGWHWRRTNEASWTDEVWSRDTQAAMGQPYTRSRYYHVYLNGTYWGIYMTQERVSGEYGESYFGGDEDDYDVLKRGAGENDGRQTEATAGTDAAWKSLFPLISDLNVTASEYAQIDAQVDLVNLADYYLLHFYSGDYDGSPSYFLTSSPRWALSNNWYAMRNNLGVGPNAKWNFFDHDSEHSLCANNGPKLRENIDNTQWNLNTSTYGDEYMAPAYLHGALVSNAAYRQIFADRVQLHMLTPGGALTEAAANARLDQRVAELGPAIEGESARWGDGQGQDANDPYGRPEWNNAVQLHRDCFADRPAIVQQQLRDDGLWPLSDPPTVAPGAGAVPYGTDVTIDDGGQGGTIYYTTDGTDPRAIDGSVSSGAVQYTGVFPVVGDVTVSARSLLGGQWTPITQSAYTLSTPAGPVGLVLNEFNAVASGNYLGGGFAGDVANGTDVSLGRIPGNGGDWFELMVVEDGLDLRGWTVEVWNESAGVLSLDASLTFGQDAVLQDLYAGSVVTVSEDIADDLSYSPVAGDWHINAQSNSALQGALITAASQSNFGINNSDTQIAIFDASGAPVQLRTGEGTAPGAGVSSTEVFKLEGTPTSSITPNSALYQDGTSSSWGVPNTWDDGASTQELSTLRIMFGDVDCNQLLNVLDAVAIAQETVGLRNGVDSCAGLNVATEMNLRASDANGDGFVNVLDAVTISQCVANLNNILCP